MHRIRLPLAFVILLAVTFVLWQHRFERDLEHPTIRLQDLKNASTLVAGASWTGSGEIPGLLLRVSKRTPSILQRFELPELPANRWLHLRLHAKATKLQPGRKPWNEGRVNLEWHSTATTWVFDPIISIRNNQDSGTVDFIVRPGKNRSRPVVRAENHAVSGDFQIARFEASVVRQTMLWQVGRWFLLAGWAAWFAVVAGLGRARSRIRPAVSGGIWLALAIVFVFPGPWKPLHPFTTAFQIGPEMAIIPQPKPPSTAATKPAVPAATRPPATKRPSVTKQSSWAENVPAEGSLVLELKTKAIADVPYLRSFLHIPLLLAPTLAGLFLTGRRPTLVLAVLISITIEVFQVLFGFGFEWLDVLDLGCDACGILLALWLHRKLCRSTALSRIGRRSGRA